MSIRRRDFILGSMVAPMLSGCGTFGLFDRRPALAFGVISDIHVTTPESTAKFRRALRYFRSRGADAVVVAGDLSDWGLRSGFRYVAEAWKDEMAGTDAVPLFCTGNHDYRNGKSALGMPRIANRAEGTEAKGYFVSVYADGSTEVERHDFEAMEEAAPAWLIPPVASGRQPYVPGEQAKRTPVPAFAAGDALRIRSANGDRRNGTWAIFYELRFPTAKAGGRVFDYEARVEREDGTSPRARRPRMSS